MKITSYRSTRTTRGAPGPFNSKICSMSISSIGFFFSKVFCHIKIDEVEVNCYWKIYNKWLGLLIMLLSGPDFRGAESRAWAWVSSNITDLRFCELQNRRRKCLSFVRVFMWSQKKGLQGKMPPFSQDFDMISKKAKDLQGKMPPFSQDFDVVSAKKKGLRSSTYWFFSVILKGPLLGPLKPTGPMMSP